MTVLVFFFIGFELVLSQRSPYAGSRPPNGYKDKFLPQNSSSNSASNSTFVTNNLALNATQRPPLSGVPIVNSEQNFQPILPNLGDSNDVAFGNRFGGASASSAGQSPSTDRLPYDAHGDRFLVQYLNQQPIENRPFWLINYQAIEAHRNGSSLYPAGSPTGGAGSFSGK